MMGGSNSQQEVDWKLILLSRCLLQLQSGLDSHESVLKRRAKGSPPTGPGGAGSRRATGERALGWRPRKGTNSDYHLFIKKGDPLVQHNQGALHSGIGSGRID